MIMSLQALVEAGLLALVLWEPPVTDPPYLKEKFKYFDQVLLLKGQI
jgi:hypothetical protein